MQQLFYILPRALAIGILISAPMGPIGMLVIQRTLSKGRRPALFTGVGAALSDLIYCLLAGLGISFVTDLITTHQLALQIAGGVVLALFGLILFRKNPTRTLITANNIPVATTYWKDFVTGFLLTFSNPLILFFIIGLFGQFNFMHADYVFYHYIAAFAAIFFGALLWWYVITFLVDKLRSRINVRSLWWINRIIGSLLIIIAVAGIFDAVMQM